MESEWQQVSSSLLDSTQYSDQPQQCCSLTDLGLSSDFQLFQLPYHALEFPFQALQLQWVSPSSLCFIAFEVLWQGLSTSISFHFLCLLLCDLLGRQSPLVGRFYVFSSFFFCSFKLFLGLVVWLFGRDYVICLHLKITENFMHFSPGWFLDCTYTI